MCYYDAVEQGKHEHSLTAYERKTAMNISGITQTAPILPMDPIQETPSGADAIGARMEASVKVMDMANDVFEDAGNRIVAMMTGLGQNFDMKV